MKKYLLIWGFLILHARLINALVMQQLNMVENTSIVRFACSIAIIDSIASVCLIVFYMWKKFKDLVKVLKE